MSSSQPSAALTAADSKQQSSARSASASASLTAVSSGATHKYAYALPSGVTTNPFAQRLMREVLLTAFVKVNAHHTAVHTAQCIERLLTAHCYQLTV